MAVSIEELARLVGGEVVGDASTVVEGYAGIDAAAAGDVTFAAGARYRDAAETTKAAAVVVDAPLTRRDVPQIVVEDPNLAFAQIVAHLAKQFEAWGPGIDPRAFVHPTAEVHGEASVRPFAVVDAGAKVAAGVVLHPHAYVGPGCEIGEGAVVFPGACLVRDVTLGKDVVIQSGAVIGSDGFGYATTKTGEHVKVPQVGRVVIEDRCEIAANTCIDRARFDVTRIGAGTKIDNLVQIAHNVEIGPHSLIVSQVGIAGSTKMGHHCVLGGGVGVSGHLTLGDAVQVGAFSGVGDHLESNGAYFGIPALPLREGRKVMMAQRRLPKLLATVRELEKRIAELEQRLASEDQSG